MQTVVIVLLSIIFTMETFSQNITADRQPYAAGRFYPAEKDQLENSLSQLFRDCKKSEPDGRVRAIISPHAGYIYSGEVAAAAFSTLPKNPTYNNIFIIGSSHVMYFDGASVYNSGDYITPLGKVKVNRDIANKLILNNKVFDFPVNAHLKEHSLEVQLPFLQYYFKDLPPIVPIIIGTDDAKTVKQIAAALKPWFTSENLFVISSDFSHYPSYKDAQVLDKLTANGLISGKPDIFLQTLKDNESKHIGGLATSMCGWTSGLTLLDLAEGDKNLSIKLVDYSNSGDSPSAGKDEVVGYNALVMTENNNKSAQKNDLSHSLTFSEEDKKQLFTIARSAILSKLDNNEKNEVNQNTLTENLKRPLGAFVTLKINGELRGCIGTFQPKEPLYEVVENMAVSSAFEDPRFSPLTMAELKKTDIEITVLGPLRRISSISEIVLGKHGIYIKKGMRAGTMLPQVATENGWTLEQFLGYTSRDKAGLGWDGWKDAEISIYEGIVLEDSRK
jgi:MEMO1 family protein